MERFQVAVVLPLDPHSHREKGQREAKPGAQLKEEVQENTYMA